MSIKTAGVVFVKLYTSKHAIGTSPQSNGICERLHRTMQEEFYAVAFRKKMYLTLDEMQCDLDEWIKYYNNDRPRNGIYCFDKTPMETFRESIILAKQKLIRQPASAA